MGLAHCLPSELTSVKGASVGPLLYALSKQGGLHIRLKTLHFRTFRTGGKARWGEVGVGGPPLWCGEYRLEGPTGDPRLKNDFVGELERYAVAEVIAEASGRAAAFR